jgi:hypothetical protein
LKLLPDGTKKSPAVQIERERRVVRVIGVMELEATQERHVEGKSARRVRDVHFAVWAGAKGRHGRGVKCVDGGGSVSAARHRKRGRRGRSDQKLFHV